MEIRVHLSDDLMLQPDAERTALEAFAIESYRSGALSHFQVSKVLGLSRFETDGFLKEHQVEEYAYGVDDLASDLISISSMPPSPQRSS
jgi:predicted HTH domain antitoxin